MHYPKSILFGGAVCLVDHSYRQHMHECWNDTIHMILTSCDGIKEEIQEVFDNPDFDANEIIKLDNLKKIYLLTSNDVLFGDEKISKVMTDKIFTNEDGTMPDDILLDLVTYLSQFRERYLYHISKKTATEETLLLRRRYSCDLSIKNAITGINLFEPLLPSTEENHNATIRSVLYILSLLTKMLTPKKVITYSLNDISDVQYVDCCLVQCRFRFREYPVFHHIFAFIKCDSVDYIYDDNRYRHGVSGKYVYNWHDLLFILKTRTDAKLIFGFPKLKSGIIPEFIQEMFRTERYTPYIFINDIYYTVNDRTLVPVSSEFEIEVYFDNVELFPMIFKNITESEEHEYLVENPRYKRFLAWSLSKTQLKEQLEKEAESRNFKTKRNEEYETTNKEMRK